MPSPEDDVIEEVSMKYPAWNKKFEVLSISKSDINEWGFVPEEIELLDEEDMEYIAYEAQKSLFTIFSFLAKNRVKIRLAEKMARKYS